MSDLLDHLNLRDLPPLDPIEPPARYSQTLLKHYDRCHRASYLYVLHHGGLPGSQLDRGSALHLAFARATGVMLAQDEQRIPPDVAKTILEEVLEEHPELTVSLAEQDDLRQMMYRWATGFTISPEHVVAVEQKFVLELDGFTISGIIDYAEINEQVATVRDYKSTFALPSEGEYEASFQCRFYAVLLMFGNPVAPDGSLGPCLGDRLTWIDVGELFPRFLHDGELALRSVGMSRLEVQEARHDIARMCRHFNQSAQAGNWPAVPGSHCSECPMEPACPLPRELRQFAGAINTPEEAAEAAMWVEKWAPRIASTRKELKLWARKNGPFRFGRDREFVFVPQQATTTDWPALDAAIEAARTFGTPFNADDYRRRRTHTRFVARTIGRPVEDEETPE